MQAAASPVPAALQLGQLHFLGTGFHVTFPLEDKGVGLFKKKETPGFRGACAS